MLMRALQSGKRFGQAEILPAYMDRDGECQPLVDRLQQNRTLLFGDASEVQATPAIERERRSLASGSRWVYVRTQGEDRFLEPGKHGVHAGSLKVPLNGPMRLGVGQLCPSGRLMRCLDRLPRRQAPNEILEPLCRFKVTSRHPVTAAAGLEPVESGNKHKRVNAPHRPWARPWFRGAHTGSRRRKARGIGLK